MMFLVVNTKGIALFLRAIATNRTDVKHSRTEFNEGASLHRDIQLANIAQDKVDELVQLFIRIYIRNVLDLIAIHKKYGFVELLAIMVGRKAVLRKHILNLVRDYVIKAKVCVYCSLQAVPSVWKDPILRQYRHPPSS